MPVTEVEFRCKHKVTRNLPAKDFEPSGKDNLTFIQRAALIDCKVCRAKARGKAEKAAAAKAEKAAAKAETVKVEAETTKK